MSRTVARHLGVMGVAAVVSGLAGLVIMVITAETLNPVANAQFMVFWSLLFWVVGALAGIQFETVRAVRTAGLAADAGRGSGVDRVVAGAPSIRRGVAVVPWGLGLGFAVAAAVAGLTWVWNREAYAGSAWVSAIALTVGAGLFGGQAALAGAAGGFGQWRWVAAMLGGEALVRLVGFGIVLAWVHSGPFMPFKLAAASGSLILLVGLVPTRRRLEPREDAGKERHRWRIGIGALHARGDGGPRSYLARTGGAVVANAASSSLINGFPALMALAMAPAAVRGAAGLMFAVTMVRAPFLVIVNAFASMLVARLVDSGQRAWRLVARLVVGLVGVTVVYAAGVAAIGPGLLAYLKPAYHLGPWVLAGLAAGAGSLTLVSLSGAWALARQRHGAYLAGWLVALLVGGGVLAGPLSATAAVIVSLLVGPLAGAAVHWATLMHSEGGRRSDG